MISVVLFAGVVALLAIAVGLAATACRRWLETGVCAGAAVVCGVLAAAGSGGEPPMWLLLWAICAVGVLLFGGLYSYMRAVL